LRAESAHLAHDRFHDLGAVGPDDRKGDDAIASARLPLVTAAARPDARVDGCGLLLYALSDNARPVALFAEHQQCRRRRSN